MHPSLALLPLFFSLVHSKYIKPVAGDDLVVTGRLLCGGKPASSVSVALTDEDRVLNGEQPWSLVMSEVGTGLFTTRAHVDSFEDYVSPTIEIVHKCNRRCIEKSRIRIPWEYALERGPNVVKLRLIELSKPFPLAEETAFCDSESDVIWKVTNGRKKQKKQSKKSRSSSSNNSDE